MLGSAGIALTGSSGISQISALQAQVLEQREETVFQRLRERYLDAPHKRRDQHREMEDIYPITTFNSHPVSSANRLCTSAIVSALIDPTQSTLNVELC